MTLYLYPGGLLSTSLYTSRISYPVREIHAALTQLPSHPLILSLGSTPSAFALAGRQAPEAASTYSSQAFPPNSIAVEAAALDPDGDV